MATDETRTYPDLDAAATDADAVFYVLSNRRRRIVVRVLQHADGPVDIGDLARAVAAQEQDVHPDEVTHRQRKSAYTALHQNHLPKLVDAGFLEVDVETLGNEDGTAYAVSETRGALLDVTPAHDPTTYTAPDDEDDATDPGTDDAPTTSGSGDDDPGTTGGDDPADGTTVASDDPPSDDAPTTDDPAEDPKEAASLSFSGSVLPWAVLFGAVVVALVLVAYRRR